MPSSPSAVIILTSDLYFSSPNLYFSINIPTSTAWSIHFIHFLLLNFYTENIMCVDLIIHERSFLYRLDDIHVGR